MMVAVMESRTLETHSILTNLIAGEDLIAFSETFFSHLAEVG
jgi:hypothetical protein